VETQSLGHSKNETIPNQIFEKLCNGWPKHLPEFDSKPDDNFNLTNRKHPNSIITRSNPVQPINRNNNYETTMTNVRSLPMITDMLLDQSKT
jgi:hypothetical protein